MIPLFRNLVEVIVALYLVLMFIEITYSFFKSSGAYSFKETLCSASVALIKRVFTLLAMDYIFTFFKVYNVSPFQIGLDVWQIIPLFFLTDFLFYVQHRLNHKYDLLWSIHEVHHSSREYNLLAANRQSFLDIIFSSVFFAPLCLLGFHPHYVIFSIYLVLFINWYAHTTFIDKIPVLEGILVTPSAHRVHHSSEARHHHQNFGGALIIWDRIFGTYLPEPHAQKITRFGINGYNYTHNPFLLLSQGPYNYLKKIYKNRFHKSTKV